MPSISWETLVASQSVCRADVLSLGVPQSDQYGHKRYSMSGGRSSVHWVALRALITIQYQDQERQTADHVTSLYPLHQCMGKWSAWTKPHVTGFGTWRPTHNRPLNHTQEEEEHARDIVDTYHNRCFQQETDTEMTLASQLLSSAM